MNCLKKSLNKMLEMQQARVKCCFQLNFHLCALRESEKSFYWNLKGVETNERVEKEFQKRATDCFCAITHGHHI
jgi:hypothetical protein